ncbi:DsbA family protein [Qipengyuania sp. MTN3-11]|uniref:DsbA family protein n=1 Tax=Qipengyuania sp. MTN3-11 TaxID=3056557 RepID=UPI0036F3A583
MTTTRRPILAAIATPLAILLAACGTDGTAEGDATLEGEPIAEIAPPAGQQWTDTVTVTEGDGYVLGNPEAPIKVVEYASLTCPACAAFATDGADQLKEEYVNTGRVSYELRNQIHGPHDLMLARLVRCGQKEAYHPRSDMVWKNLQAVLQPVFDNEQAFSQALQLPEEQRFVQAAQVAGFYDFFSRFGLSRDEAQSCLADFSSMETIAANSTQQSNEFEVTGTPTFFVNGQKLDVNRWTDLEPILQQAGAR